MHYGTVYVAEFADRFRRDLEERGVCQIDLCGNKFSIWGMVDLRVIGQDGLEPTPRELLEHVHNALLQCGVRVPALDEAPFTLLQPSEHSNIYLRVGNGGLEGASQDVPDVYWGTP